VTVYDLTCSTRMSFHGHRRKILRMMNNCTLKGIIIIEKNVLSLTCSTVQRDFLVFTTTVPLVVLFFFNCTFCRIRDLEL